MRFQNKAFLSNIFSKPLIPIIMPEQINSPRAINFSTSQHEKMADMALTRSVSFSYH